MEGFFAEKSRSSITLTTSTSNNEQQIDLTLQLSPCCHNNSEKEKFLAMSSSSICREKAEMITVANEGPFVPFLERCCSLPAQGEKGVMMRFRELQTMRRVRSGKRLLLQRQRRAAAAASRPPPASGQPPPARRVIDKHKKAMSPYGDSCHQGDGKMEILRKMPSVTTIGDGSTGKRIQGLLYKYSRGQVCIVCVCHGSFLSPAEFVMHAGGKEVANPMKQITVCSNLF